MSKGAPADIASLQRATILVADDDAFARKTVQHVLKKTGFEQVLEADSGERVAEILQTETIALLITDVQMPGCNGIEMLRRIRAGESAGPRDLRVMVHTSFAHRDVLAAAMALDVNGFLVKPMKADTVREKVIQAMCERLHVRSPMAYSAVPTLLNCVPELTPEMIAANEASSGDTALAQRTKPNASTGAAQGRWVDLRFLTPGDFLLEDVVSVDGAILLSHDTELTEPQINRLIDLGGVVANRRALVK